MPYYWELHETQVSFTADLTLQTVLRTMDRHLRKLFRTRSEQVGLTVER
jgi:hypothetical protein